MSVGDKSESSVAENECEGEIGEDAYDAPSEKTLIWWSGAGKMSVRSIGLAAKCSL